MVNEKLSKVAQRLWDLDVNRFEPNNDFIMDLQCNCTKDDAKNYDKCPNPLFAYVDVEKLRGIPTYAKFYKLLDNYVLDTKKNEDLTFSELNEESEFLDACLQTAVMKEAYNFLVEEEIVDNPKEFKDLLWNFWFEYYSRNSSEAKDSSAFEHVFVGEQKGKTGVLGCHNWLQYYILEQTGQVDYYGYIKEECEYSDDPEQPVMLCMRFMKNGIVKALGGFLVGVSPEFEMALYTILFFCSGQNTRLNFANMSILFHCYKMERDGVDVLATIFASKN